MKINSSKRSTTRKKLIIVASALVGLILVFAILETTGITHFISPPDSQTTDQIKEAETNSSNKQDFIEGKSNDPSNDNSTIPEPTSDDITLSVRQETDRSVTISTELRNYSDGTCDLTIKNGSETHNQTAPVIYQPAFSTCAGFSIPANTLANGTWQISLVITSKGKVNTKTTSVEIQ
jgi:hypothetical protein